MGDEKKIVPTEPGWWWVKVVFGDNQSINALHVRPSNMGLAVTIEGVHVLLTHPKVIECVTFIRPVLSMDEEDQLRADVARMQVTKDGKRVMNGDMVWWPSDQDVYPGEVVNGFAFLSVFLSVGLNPNRLVSDCYSTPELARKAAKKGLQ